MTTYERREHTDLGTVRAGFSAWVPSTPNDELRALLEQHPKHMIAFTIPGEDRSVEWRRQPGCAASINLSEHGSLAPWIHHQCSLAEKHPGWHRTAEGVEWMVGRR